MIVKINRVGTIEESNTLDHLRVDIIGVSIDREKKGDETACFDSRAISLEEAIIFKKNLAHAKLAVLVNHYADNETLWKEILETLQPDFINYFLPLYEQYDTANKVWFENEAGFLNNLPVPVILFGESIVYDKSFSFRPGDEKRIKNLSFMEIRCFTLNQNNPLHIRQGKSDGFQQSESSSLLYETVQFFFEKIPVLLDDDLDKKTIHEDIENCRAKGITLSLKSREEDVWTDRNTNGNFFNIITANTYEMDEITE